MTRALLLVLPLAGCTQILGLDETQGPGVDGGLPACDQELDCGTSEICGRIYDFATGASVGVAGDPVLCLDGDSTAPCNLAVVLKGYPDLQGAPIGVNLARDSCGRFVIDSAPLGAQVFSIQVSGTSYAEAATLITGNDVAHGDNVEVRVAAVRDDYFSSVGGFPPNLSPLPWLVTTIGPAGTPQMANVIKRNGTTITAGTAIDYYSDQDRLAHQLLDTTRASTGLNGTGLIVNASGELSTGCDRTLLNAVAFPAITVHYNMYCDI